MGHAAGFGHALGNQRLVARVIVAYQRAAPLTQEALRMLAGTTFGEVIDDRLDRFEGANTVGPQVGAMRLAGAGIEHRHRRLIGMQDRMREHLVFQGINQRLQGHAHLTYPLGQGRLRDGQPRTSEDGFLAIQRQVVQVFGNEHLGEQPGGRNPFIDHMRRNQRLHQRCALGTGPLAADVPFHRKGARGVVELLGDIFADALHLAATGTGRRFRFVVNLGARQFRRQRLAFGVVFLLGRGTGQPFEFFADRGQIGGGRLFEQLRLLGRQMLRLHAIALSLVVRQLVGKLVDPGLTRDQQTTQFVSVESVKMGGKRHASNHARQWRSRPGWTSTMAYLQRIRITPPSARRSQGKPRIRASNCARVSASVPLPLRQ